SDLLAGAAWLEAGTVADLVDEDAEATFTRVQELVGAIRTERARHGVNPRRQIVLHAPAAIRDLLAAAGPVAPALAGLSAVEDLPDARPAGAIPLAVEGAELMLSGLVDAVDVGAERTRLAGLIEAREAAIAGYRRKLENPGYVQKAPPPVVQETRDRLAEAEADLAAARQALEALPAE
ncbi:MAG: valine--tRNA ligase, partial [Planctomycetota bacterium]